MSTTSRQPTTRYSRRDDCLVFMHIPKTAGTSLVSSLMWNYPVHSSLRLNLLGMPLSDLDSIPLERRSRLRLLYGHLPYGVHKHIPRPCSYVTIVREPVDRVISAYKYVLKTAHHRDHDVVVNGGISLEEYVESFWVDERISRQTRQLCNKYDGPLDEHDLQRAKRNLEQLLVVGLTECFEETFVLLRRALRFRFPFYVTRNVSPPLQAADEVRKLIAEQERFDLELYDFARDLFTSRVARQGASFRTEVEMFRALRPLSRLGGSGGRTERLLRALSHARTRRK
jgi:hypothetical protein